MSFSTVADIGRAIEEFKGLRSLRLEGNTIGVEAAQSIAKALENKSELEVLSTANTVHCITKTLWKCNSCIIHVIEF